MKLTDSMLIKSVKDSSVIDYNIYCVNHIIKQCLEGGIFSCSTGTIYFQDQGLVSGNPQITEK